MYLRSALTKLIPVAQQWMPPGGIELLRRSGVYRYGFFGDYSSWSEATLQCGPGYLDPSIASRTRADAVRVSQEAQSNPELDAPALSLLAALLYALRAHEGPYTSILDFGGALGGHYFALRRFLNERSELRWTICETPALVEAAATLTMPPELAFISDVATAPGPFAAVVCSGSLQYVDEPLEVLRGLLARTKWVIVDRLPLTENARHRIAVQRVPPWIYTASYPVWMFSEPDFLRAIEPLATIVMRWRKEETISYKGETLRYQGLLLRSRLKAEEG